MIASMLFYSLPCSAYLDVTLVNAKNGTNAIGNVSTVKNKPEAIFTTSERDWSKTFTIKKVIDWERTVYLLDDSNKGFVDKEWGFKFATKGDAALFFKEMNNAIAQQGDAEDPLLQNTTDNTSRNLVVIVLIGGAGMLSIVLTKQEENTPTKEGVSKAITKQEVSL